MNVEINGSPILTTLPIFGGIPLTATLVVTWSIMLLLTRSAFGSPMICGSIMSPPGRPSPSFWSIPPRTL